jgi:hypothetical protein
MKRVTNDVGHGPGLDEPPRIHDGDAIRDLEHEVGVLIRRVRRVIGLRARAVHDAPGDQLSMDVAIWCCPKKQADRCHDAGVIDPDRDRVDVEDWKSLPG